MLSEVIYLTFLSPVIHKFLQPNRHLTLKTDSNVRDPAVRDGCTDIT
jgi:hypothetical protein